MFQAFECSCFSTRTPLREQGFLIPPQRTLTITNRYQHKIRPSRLVCQRSSASSADEFRKLARKTRVGTPKTWLRWSQKSPSTLRQCSSMTEAKTESLATFQSDLCKKFDAFYRFSRPHTIIGTIIGITSVSLLPIQSITELSPAFLAGLLKALIPAISMNIYVVGLNQLFDVEIDKVNKPNLPLASGEFSMGLGMAIVSTFVLMSLAMGIIFQSPPLLSALLISFVLGSAYSVELPLLRWKRHAFLAAFCILIVRALVVQLAFFLHIQKYVLGKPVMFTKSLVFAVSFMCLFTTVIALFKDIPDVDGDRSFGIQSFSVSLGQERVFWLCISMMLMAYGAAVLIGASSSFLPSRLITVIGHLSLALFLWHRARSVDLSCKASVTSFYMLIWKLFYAEYFLIPFVR